MTILEKSPTLGGKISTIEREGFRIECGPNGIFDAKPSTLQLCRDLGLGDRLVVASEAARKNRYLLLDGRLRALPGSLLSFVAWTIYAGTLAGRAAAGWHGRRAAYFAIIGFATLVLTLGAGLFLPGRHGS